MLIASSIGAAKTVANRSKGSGWSFVRARSMKIR
jgi:hypothetical protein